MYFGYADVYGYMFRGERGRLANLQNILMALV